MTVFRCATAAVVAALPQCALSPAHAVSPPPIDNSRLPQPAPPSPPRPTVQREICAVPSVTRDADPPDATSQLTGLDLPQVWKLTRGSGQRVAVIDTGVSPHPRLHHTAAGGDYVFTGDGTQDCDGHGTAVAGIVSAAPDPRHADSFSGVAPNVALISIRQSSNKFGAAADPSNSGFGDVDTMARAVRTAADLGASVINISSVACIRTGSALDDRALGAALSYAVDVKNAVVVVAAGNTGAGQCPTQQAQVTWDTATVVVSPAWYDDYVLTVGSVNAQGEPSSFTLAGPWVDVAAPGEGVISLSSSGDGLVNTFGGQRGSVPLSGTSYAAPVVSGLAALVRSRFPMLTARQVMQRIKTTAHHPPSGWDPRVGAGLVDFLAAVSTDTASNPTPPPAPTAMPILEPPLPARPDHSAQRLAFTGAAVCGGVLATVLAIAALRTRLRRAQCRAGRPTHIGENVLGD
ncbi:type VII secretion-associated serine protease mycosin [Mycobacterium sp.]|uniref:type VII secretion-associated serine protease mycosin n=1 Tax=Mycobacterium sp. TaxID=1785 RepID=UPI003F957959